MDRRHIRADAALLRQAVRGGWSIPEAIKQDAAGILEVIAREPTKVIATMAGPVEVSNAPAQIAAIQTLAMLSRENQTDYWNQNKNERLDAGQSTENIAFKPAPTYDVPLPPDIAKRLTGEN